MWLIWIDQTRVASYELRVASVKLELQVVKKLWIRTLKVRVEKWFIQVRWIILRVR